ncbi:MAG: type II toxin-antitoxin system HicA family toxin [Tepidiformaceae bacterium]
MDRRYLDRPRRRKLAAPCRDRDRIDRVRGSGGLTHVGTAGGLRRGDFVRAAERQGWRIVRRRGSHIVMKGDGAVRPLVVPDHREIGEGLARSILREMGLSVDVFLAQARK